MKKILLILLSVLVITGCNKQEKQISNELLENEVVEVNEIIEEVSEENNSKEELPEDIEEIKPKESKSNTKLEPNTKSNTKTTTTTKNTNNTKTNINAQKNNDSKNNTNTQTNNTSNNNATTVKKEEPKTTKQEIWDKLGMTEYHYYNEPMYSWEHVDFSVNTYGNELKTRNACLEYGDKYQPYLDGKVSYNCSRVTSTSGKYLGEMFYTENLS